VSLDLNDNQKPKVDDVRERQQDDLLRFATTDWGQRIIRRIMRRCGLWKSSFTGNSKTYYLAGQRDIGLWLFREIADVKQVDKTFLGEILMMIQETEE
jgi:hypothetical protein